MRRKVEIVEPISKSMSEPATAAVASVAEVKSKDEAVKVAAVKAEVKPVQKQTKPRQDVTKVRCFILCLFGKGS